MKINFANTRDAIGELVEYAISKDASDIHINPRKHIVEIFFRARGALAKVGEISIADYNKLRFEMKRTSNVNAVQKTAQDGRLQHTTADGALISMRFASVYCRMFDSDKITIRIPGKDVNLLDIDNIQFRKEDIERMKLAFRKNFGLLLVTGPTGSGKTTTLYAGLNYIKNLGTLNILTAEDPVEAPVSDTVQIETTHEMSFNAVLKSFLRHDPDVILIGETRDTETAEISVKAALTGHLVLTTLHANTALLSVTRMLDLGIDPFNLIFTLVSILNQRLLKTLCPKCKKTHKITYEAEYIFKKFNRPIPTELSYQNHEGCDNCFNGISGRTIIYELMTFDTQDQEKLFSVIKANLSLEENFLPYYKQKTGHITMTDMAITLLEQGIIDPEEVLKFA